MKEYVLVFADPGEDKEVLLVLKDRPDWQKGRYNLLGGKVEPDETANFAAVRELHEESGLNPIEHASYSGTISGLNSLIHVVTVPVDRKQPIQPRIGETELVDWYSWTEMEANPKLMPNLRIAVPLLQKKVFFTLNDITPYRNDETYHNVIVCHRSKDGVLLRFNCKIGNSLQPIIWEAA